MFRVTCGGKRGIVTVDVSAVSEREQVSKRQGALGRERTATPTSAYQPREKESCLPARIDGEPPNLAFTTRTMMAVFRKSAKKVFCETDRPSAERVGCRSNRASQLKECCKRTFTTPINSAARMMAMLAQKDRKGQKVQMVLRELVSSSREL